MKVLVIEDEIHNFNSLRRMLREIEPSIEIEGPVTSVAELLGILQSQEGYDIAFADIRLDDGLCFEAFTDVELTMPVIFTTAYDEYALQAFENNGIGYLLKPLEIESLRKSINMARKMKLTPDSLEAILDAYGLRSGKRYPKRLLAMDADGTHVVNVKDICYVAKEEGDVNAYTSDGQRHRLQYSSLDKVEEELDPESFFRANRQYIVGISDVESVKTMFRQSQRCRLHHFPKIDIDISKERVGRFKDWLQGLN